LEGTEALEEFSFFFRLLSPGWRVLRAALVLALVATFDSLRSVTANPAQAKTIAASGKFLVCSFGASF
jgi:hypothetical protein